MIVDEVDTGTRPLLAVAGSDAAELMPGPAELAGGAGDLHDAAQSSASKAVALLGALARIRCSSFGLTELAEDMGLPKSTTHRLLKTLEEHRFVARSGPRYRLGGRFFELNEAARWSEYGELRDAACRPLGWLFERSDAIAVHLAALSGPDVVYLDKITRPEGARLPSRVGGRFPATCTALGKAMLAFSDRSVVKAALSMPLARVTPYSIAVHRRLLEQLDQVRVTGYAVECEEACQGTLCVAAPILYEGRATAAISLCVDCVGPGRRALDRVPGYARLAAEAAAVVARLLPAD